ncbi:MAG: ascorbate-dependent monooxygenase [Acidobacteria bacterium]|nr:ascorbate-dependent monooxygenase [Acidobacteriota bacterium]
MKILFALSATVFLLPSAGVAQPTYAKEVSRILHAKCAQCHRPNDIAPFSLLTYQDAADYAPDIKRVVEEGIMPPWKPVHGFNEFRDSYGLTADEKQQLLDWAGAGAPKGNDADLPEPPQEKGEWLLGKPDLELKMPEPFTAVRGRDIYRCFVLPTGLDADKFISAIDILPGSRQVVHHVIVYLDTTGESEKLDARDEGPGYNCYGGPGFRIATETAQLLSLNITLGGWAPGTRARHLPEGIGMYLDKRARVVLQVHYYTTRGAREDQTRVGLYFNAKPPEKRLIYVPLVDEKLRIPAGDANYTNAFSELVPPLFDLKVVNVFPHMHLIGREIKVEAEASGETKPIIYINKWDFNWQGPYTLVDPLSVPGMGRIKVSCTYDNSSGNPRNPNNPVKEVRWGEGTEDEMCVAFVGVTFDRDSLLLR